MRAVASHLDQLGADARVEEIRTLGRAQQARLFEAAQGHRPLSLNDLVPSDQPPMQEVVHHGKNSLPVFNRFAKAFVRPLDSPTGELWGYNRAGAFVETVVGPGYFVACQADTPGELLIDYVRVPPERPAHWPEVLPNSARVSRLVYNGTQDVLRGVSEHVTIGRAFRGGKPMSAWFALCRDPQT